MTDKDKERIQNDKITINKQILMLASRGSIKQKGSELLSANQYEKCNSPGGNSHDFDEETLKFNDGSEWEKSVEILALNHRRISKIANLEPFLNLRRLSFIDNCIERIEGIQKCKLLEELSFEKNKITKIEGIGHL